MHICLCTQVCMATVDAPELFTCKYPIMIVGKPVCLVHDQREILESRK